MIRIIGLGLGLLLASSALSDAAKLQGVEVRPLDSGTEVVIRFSSLPAYSYAPAPNPFRVTVTAVSTVSRMDFSHARAGIVSGVRLEESAGGQARIEILLDGPASFEVRERGTSIVLLLVPEADAGGAAHFPVPDFTGSTARNIGSLKVRRVAVDAGHGGLDPGASYFGVHEKDVVLALARRLADLINRRGRAEAFLTRSGDYFIPLQERPLIANQYRADLFVSIHVNANENPVHRGSETYFCSERASDAMAALVAERENRVIHEEEQQVLSRNAVDIEEILFQFERKLYWEDSRQVSSLILQGMVGSAGTADRGVHSANFSVLRNAKMPAVLAEIGFLSNPQEAKRLTDPAFQQRVVEGIYGALESLIP